MSTRVEFEDQEFQKPAYHRQQPASVWHAYLIENGWAHDKASANKLLLFVSVLIFLTALIVFYVFVVRTSIAPATLDISEEEFNRLPYEIQQRINADR